MKPAEQRLLSILAPIYPELTAYCTVAVELERTPDDWLKLVFQTPDSSVEKEASCVNAQEGCRCDYVRLLRALMILREREILSININYQVSTTEGDVHGAILEVSASVHRHARTSDSLKGFELVLSHLQSQGLAIARRSASSRREAKQTELLEASHSSCHVVGCRLHQFQKDLTMEPKAKLSLPDVLESLIRHMETEQMEIREDATYVTRMQHPHRRVLMTDLPSSVLQSVVCLMDARDLAQLSGVCSLFRHLAYEVVPGLNLVLFEHQRKGLKWMLHRETPSLSSSSLPHPFMLPGCRDNMAIDFLDQTVVENVDTMASDTCGGLFCDEPGLGKTITILALILRTKGISTHKTVVDLVESKDESPPSGLRPARSRDRSVPAADLIDSGASLIVVPDPLVEHWKYQIEAHMAQGALRTFIDESKDDLPSNRELAAYDVVVTSFSRLTREWKLNRPPSALEQRMPERYGFEGPQRYADGSIRGDVSSLLTVNWVRVIVDEGHKLGGQTPTNLMQMARTISAERRWIMTGTPTPNTLQSADLKYMHGLLVFLRNKPYGNPDGRAWTKAITRPFEQNQPVGFYRLQSLLSRIMMRHTKASIREILPDPVRQTVFIDPTPSEYAQYNVVAAAVRANLVITNMDPHDPGRKHADSLLNPSNQKEALQVVSNLRLACCGGVKSEVVLSDKARLETINMLSETGVDGDNIANVIEYLRRVKLPGMTTECKSCKRQLQLLMIMPCGHLCCADCVEDRIVKIGPSCYVCNEVYDPESFQLLQPGFDFREVDGDNANGNNRRRGVYRTAQAPRERTQQPQNQAAPNHTPEGTGPNPHYWTVDASKVFYAATRVRELKKEFARRGASQGACSSQSRYVKVIIFSQFTEIIWRTKLAFEQQKIPTANFITRVSPKARMNALKRFRTDPSLNVLLLSEMGSHGLDLSFVTHIFLMEEIWDKSLEQQVVSRAHRMGAKQPVVVEQLWMRGTLESQMAKVSELGEDSKPAPRIIHNLGPPARPLKKDHINAGNALLNVAGKKRKRNHIAESPKVQTGNKRSFLQRKLDYVLNHLRLLGDSVVAEPRQVRFFVMDENEGVVRQAIHIMQSPTTPAVTSSSDNRLRLDNSAPHSSGVNSSQPTQTARAPLSEGSHLQPEITRRPSGLRESPVMLPVQHAQSTQLAKARASSAKRVAAAPLSQTTIDAAFNTLETVFEQPPTKRRAISKDSSESKTQPMAIAHGGASSTSPDDDIIEISDDPIRRVAQTTLCSDREVIVIDDSSSESDTGGNNGSTADDEAQSGSENESNSDSDESDGDLDEAFAKLKHIVRCKRNAQEAKEQSEAKVSSALLTLATALNAVDDDETETE